MKEAEIKFIDGTKIFLPEDFMFRILKSRITLERMFNDKFTGSLTTHVVNGELKINEWRTIEKLQL